MRQGVAHGLQGDGCRRFCGIAVDAGADAREGDAAYLVRFGKMQAVGVGSGELCGFVLPATMPDRADGVDDVAGGQAVAGSDFCLACLAAVELAAFGKQLRPGSAVNGTVHPASAQQGVVGGVDDGVNGQGGDVGNGDFDGAHGGARMGLQWLHCI